MSVLCEPMDVSDGPRRSKDQRTHYTLVMFYTSNTSLRQVGFLPVLMMRTVEPDL